jgi:hypothetical protein
MTYYIRDLLGISLIDLLTFNAGQSSFFGIMKTQTRTAFAFALFTVVSAIPQPL